MTRKEAIRLLSGLMFKGKLKEALDVAIKALEQEPTTKNNLPHCQYTDEEIAKSFIEDVEAVKDQLPCGEQMDFPNTFDEFAKDYGFKDKDEIYTNGIELIPVYRVKQWLEHITPIRSKGHWIEYPHEWGDNWQYSKYECSCCGDWANFDTDYCPNCGAEMEEVKNGKFKD